MDICASRELSHHPIHRGKRGATMNHRSVFSMYLLMTVLAFLLLMTVSVAAQAPVSPGKAPAAVKNAKKWTARTPDGQPDLQGYWTNSTYTPLQRPQGVTKEF